MTKEIELSKGKIALVDDGDYPWLIRQEWYFDGRYAAGSKYHHDRYQAGLKVWTTRLYMHRHILDAPANLTVDHIDGDKLNNTRANLRLCTQKQNGWNTKGQARGSTGYKGVRFEPRRNCWVAEMSVNGRGLYLGAYTTPEAAAYAYDRAAQEHHGEFAFLNFPEFETAPPGERITRRSTPSRDGSTSKYKGVTWVKSRGKWRALISINGRQQFLGEFTNELDAAQAYETALAQLSTEVIL